MDYASALATLCDRFDFTPITEASRLKLMEEARALGVPVEDVRLEKLQPEPGDMGPRYRYRLVICPPEQVTITVTR